MGGTYGAIILIIMIVILRFQGFPPNESYAIALVIAALFMIYYKLDLILDELKKKEK